MPSNNLQNNKRIVKNTLFLYVRTLFVMAVSLFTSRIILQTLGVDDYGIYNAVGGVVAMFSVVTGALSTSISRFLTFELGKGDVERLKVIFSTSVNILVGVSILVIVVGEIVGLWFVNSKMNIPTDRLYATNWVLHCALLSFAINLISIPYNAAIIAHERMSAFAYVSILEVSLKLLIVYLLYMSSWDRLITYSILLVVVSAVIRFVYGIYCNRNFMESKYRWTYNKVLVKEMTGFAGWSFFTNCAYIFNTQGVNILINLFFGVGCNAARGIAIQMEGAIKKFVLDFTTAINPQIVKNYASGKFEELYKLICRGARFSFLLLFCLALPFLFETPTILKLWLNIVPDHTVAFFRLSIIATLIDLLGNSGYTACMATGNIRKYSLIITSVGCLVFPLSWLLFKLGFPVESCYVVFASIYLLVDVVRLFLMKQLIGFPPLLFFKDVVLRIVLVSVLSIVLPLIIVMKMDPSICRLIVCGFTCFASSSLVSFYFGLSSGERGMIVSKIKSRFFNG